jgi:hypothetical protein
MALDMAMVGAGIVLVERHQDKREKAVKRINARNGKVALGGW